MTLLSYPLLRYISSLHRYTLTLRTYLFFLTQCSFFGLFVFQDILTAFYLLSLLRFRFTFANGLLKSIPAHLPLLLAHYST